MTNDGDVYVDIGYGVAVDLVGNKNSASSSTTNVVEYDTTPPSIVAPTGPVMVAADAGANGAIVTFDVTATDGAAPT